MRQKSFNSRKGKKKRRLGSNVTNHDEIDVTVNKTKTVKSRDDIFKSESNDFGAFAKTVKNSQAKSIFNKKGKAKRNTDGTDGSFTSNLRASTSSSECDDQGESDLNHSSSGNQKSQLKPSFIRNRKPKRTKDVTLSMPSARMSDSSSESDGQSESDMEYKSDRDASEKHFKLGTDSTDTGDRQEKPYFDDEEEDDDDDDDTVENFQGTSTKYLRKQGINKETNEQDSDGNIEDNRDEDGKEDSDLEKDDNQISGEDVDMQMGANMEDEKDKFTAIRKELAEIAFEDLLKIKEKVGVKAFNKILHGNIEDKPIQTSFKRANKNRPREMSSKRPVSRFRGSKEKQSWVARDPRFDDLSGQFREYHFNKNYSFIEGIKEKERQTVKKEMKRSRNDKKKRELKNLLSRMEQEQKVQAMRKQKQDLDKIYREKEKELVKEGKTPYFLKKSDKKTLELAMKFKELKQSGKLDRYMIKKRKKVAQKQRRKMPSKPS